jgi:hypothetical protein
MKMNAGVSAGITMGSALAMIISFTMYHSIGWAVLHGVLSWVYVIYAWIWLEY